MPHSWKESWLLVAVIRWGTTARQEVASGTLADIVQRAAGLAAPATIVIGDVAAQRHATLELDQGRDLVEDLRVGQGLPVSHGLTVQDG